MQKELEPLFPRIVIIARDVLYIPYTGITIEQCFSIARYYYRHNQTYNRSTFSALIIGQNFLSYYENVVAKAESFVNNSSRFKGTAANALLEAAQERYKFRRDNATVEAEYRHYTLENAMAQGLLVTLKNKTTSYSREPGQHTQRR